MSDFDAVVVGSGVGGMSAALQLARCGHSVALVEASDDFGGLLRPVVRDGYSFDVGLHYVGKAGPGEWFRACLDDLGLSSVQFVELDPDGFDRYVFPGYEFRFCKGKQRLVERLVGEFPAEADGIRRFFDTVSKVDEALLPAEMRHHGLFAALRYLRHHPILLRYGRATYDKVLNHFFSSEQLKAVLSAPLFDVAAPPNEVSAIAAMSVWGHFLEGAYYPRGGSRGLRDAFVRALRDNSVELMPSSPVALLDRRGDAWITRLDSGDEISARAVVSAVDPTITLGRLVAAELVPVRVRRKAMQLRPSAAILFAHVGTDLDLPALGLGNSNIATFASWSLDDYYGDWRAFDHATPENGCFVSSPSLKDPEGGLAPRGKHSLDILGGASYELFERWSKLPADARGSECEALTRNLGERLIAVAEQQVPGLSSHLDFVEFRSPLFVADRTRAVRGGIYGPDHTPAQMGYGRFPSLESGIDQLYLAGAGTMGAGVALCCASGVLAAQLADERLGQRRAHAA